MDITPPLVKSYSIAAVFEIGMPEYDAVFMPLTEAQFFFGRTGNVTAVEVYLDEADSVTRLQQRITEAAGRPVIVTNWRQRSATYLDTK